MVNELCKACEGSGAVPCFDGDGDRRCDICDGHGVYPDQRLTVRVPPMPALPSEARLAKQLRDLAHDLQSGKVSETDQRLVAALLAALITNR